MSVWFADVTWREGWLSVTAPESSMGASGHEGISGLSPQEVAAVDSFAPAHFTLLGFPRLCRSVPTCSIHRTAMAIEVNRLYPT